VQLRGYKGWLVSVLLLVLVLERMLCGGPNKLLLHWGGCGCSCDSGLQRHLQPLAVGGGCHSPCLQIMQLLSL
jgi:hypothetical protein